MQGSLRHIRYSILFTCTALVLATNYFAFQAELFDAEYEANHPLPSSSSSPSLTTSTLTWESFDKDNAPQAFTVDPGLATFCIFILPSEQLLPSPPDPTFCIVRDKSPPLPQLIHA